MKKKMPVIMISGVLTALLALSTAGCSGNSNGETSTPPSPTPEEAIIENKDISITFDVWDGGELETIACDGTYTGEIRDGVPHGEGEFVAENESGVLWKYTGEFKDGVFDGSGELLWADGYSEIGTYVNGTYMPTPSELLVNLSKSLYVEFNVSEESQKFIEANEDIFLAVGEESIKKADGLVNHDVTYEMMSKNVSPYKNQLISFGPSNVIQVDEFERCGNTITTIICSDEEWNVYFIIYYGSLPNVFSDSVINFTALPIDKSGYENAGGGYTHAIVLAGCVVTSVE